MPIWAGSSVELVTSDHSGIDAVLGGSAVVIMHSARMHDGVLSNKSKRLSSRGSDREPGGYRFWPDNAQTQIMHGPPHTKIPTIHHFQKAIKMANEAQIQAAIERLNQQSKKNYSAVAQEFNIDCTTLYHRYTGKTVSRSESRSIYIKKLTNAQEQALIDTINRLSKRGLSPTPQIVRNLASEIANQPIRKY